MRKFDFSKQDKSITEEIIEAGPRGTAASSTKNKYDQEYIYQTEAYKEFIGGTNDPTSVNSNTNTPISVLKEKEPKSFFMDHQHYGRINSQLMSLYPKESSLINIGDINNPVHVLDFVSDAYDDFSLDINLFIQRNNVPKSSFLHNLSPQNGVDKVPSLYLNYSNQNYSYLLDFIKVKRKEKDIYSINDFILVLADFIDFLTPTRVFTKSSFVYSRSCPTKTSGLVIDLFDGDVNDDVVKYEKFINNPYFSCYMDYVKERGFIINKDAPWQLIADLNSERMKFYYNQRVKGLVEQGLLSEDVFYINCDRFEDCKEELKNFNLFSNLIDGKGGVYYYNIVNENDLYELKKIIGKMYEFFLEYSPSFEETEIKKIQNRFETITLTHERLPIDFEQFVESEITKELVKLYVFMKARESNSNWSQRKFLDVVEKTYNLSRKLDISEAMVYLQSEINRKEITGRKNLNFRF